MSPDASRRDEPDWYLAIEIGGETIALSGILDICEIVDCRRMKPRGSPPAHLIGDIDTEAEHWPVIDLGVLFGRPTVHDPKRASIVVIAVESDGACRHFGIIADAVCGILDIPDHDIAPQVPRHWGNNGLDGIRAANVGNRPVVIVDTARFISISALVASRGPSRPAIEVTDYEKCT